MKSLQNYLKIDIFGKCGNLSCENAHNGQNSCIDDNAGIYYFYLAFENSICPDYISEKYWRNINLPVVPVVLGGANYSKDVPPHSYIGSPLTAI